MKWFLAVLFLLLAALLLESGLLSYAMYVLLGLLLISRFMTTSWISGLEAVRVCDADEVEAGDSVNVTVTVENNSMIPVLWVLLEDMVPARTTLATRKNVRIKKKRMKMTRIPAHGEAEMEYQIQFRRRGYYQIGPLVLETGDLFGLHRRYHVATEPHFVLVYPLVVPLEDYDLASRRPVGEIRLTHRLYEDPTRISGVREYQQGDPLNRVHWAATARTGLLHCKQYEPSAIAGASILLDFHESGYPSAKEPERSELGITICASLAFALYEMGEQVGFFTNARDAAQRIRTEGWAHDFRSRDAALKSVDTSNEEKDDRLEPIAVPTDRGMEQFERIWATLARAELTDGLTFAQLLMEITSRLPRNATVIAVLPTVSSETALALGSLRQRGFAVTAALIAISEAEYEEAHIRLRAEGLEVLHVLDNATLSALCRKAAR